MEEKIKVLWLSDFLCNSGFANVAQNIMKRLIKTGRYEFTVIGINYLGDPYDHDQWPIKVYPAQWLARQDVEAYRDVFGRQRVIDALLTGNYDLFFSIQDLPIITDKSFARAVHTVKKELKDQGKKMFRWIHYFPIDSTYVRDHWVIEGIDFVDLPVAYTEFGRNLIKDKTTKKVEVMPHGIDLTDFHPLPEAEIREAKENIFNGAAKGKFLISNINKNQRRKDIPTTIKSFALFHKQRPDSYLYLHMTPDLADGCDIRVVAHDCGLKLSKDYLYPFTMTQEGIGVEHLNLLYNVTDLVVTTTLGEGWGLSLTEAMATKTPVIGPDHTSLTEIIGKDRGILVPAEESINLGTVDLNLDRPKLNAETFADGIKKAYFGPNKNEPGYDWVTKNLNWDDLAKKWDELFLREYRLKTVQIKVGRNEMCPQPGCLKKWKHCTKHNPDAVR